MEWIHKLDEVERRFDDLSAQMAEPDIMQDQERYQKAAKSASDLSELVDKFRTWKSKNAEVEATRPMMSEPDADMAEMAKQEVANLEASMADLESEMKLLMLPPDPNDEKGVVLEVRAGTGGDEAALFAGELFRLYTRYAEINRWKVDITSSSETGIGGVKEVIAMISGKRVYSRLKFESGVHRVQRVPQTETQGRVHTSAVTVVVMPQVDEVEVHIEAKDIRIDTYCSSGPGGQSVNTTYSAVRVTHLPTNTIVTCQDEKSQIKNKAKALQVLRSRIYEMEYDKQHAKEVQERRSIVRTGDRSEKIRTYNFPQNRVTDHRVPGLTLHQLDLVMDGRLDPLIDALAEHHQAELLNQELVSTGR
jgi:peptide chain release factor 1